MNEAEQAKLYIEALYGEQGFGNINTLDAGWIGDSTLSADKVAPMPRKTCNYRKPRVAWYGEATQSYWEYSVGFEHSRHWDVTSQRIRRIDPDILTVKGRNPSEGLSVFIGEIGDTIEEYNPLKGKRFIGISEPDMSERVDENFLKRFTGDEWVETKTLNKKSSEWKPQGEIFVMSGKPLRMHNKDKETIERVQDITFP